MGFNQHTTARLDELTHELLLALLRYDPVTGLFIRLRPTARHQFMGEIADKPRGKKRRTYRYIRLWKKTYNAHTLAWFYVTGAYPASIVDHKDCNPNNNSFNNLRLATRLQNRANTRIGTNSRTQLKGVAFSSKTGFYYASITIKGKVVKLGKRKTAEAASDLYMKAARDLYGEFARRA